VGKLED